MNVLFYNNYLKMLNLSVVGMKVLTKQVPQCNESHQKFVNVQNSIKWTLDARLLVAATLVRHYC